MAITWKSETRKLKELKPWKRNPREINKVQAGRLAESFDEFGQVETIAIGPDNEVYNGHQRLSVLLVKEGAEYEVDVRVSSQPLTEKQREKLTIYLHKGATGDWDWDTLANEFEFEELKSWGFDNLETLFEPTIDPSLTMSNHDQGDMDDAEKKLNGQYTSEQSLVKVICPHCNEIYFLDKADIEKDNEND